MLFELKFYYKDGHISHDLIECDSPLILDIAKRAKFSTTLSINREYINSIKLITILIKSSLINFFILYTFFQINYNIKPYPNQLKF